MPKKKRNQESKLKNKAKSEKKTNINNTRKKCERKL